MTGSGCLVWVFTSFAFLVLHSQWSLKISFSFPSCRATPSNFISCDLFSSLKILQLPGFVSIAYPPSCTTSREISFSLSEQFDEEPNKEVTTKEIYNTEELHNEQTTNENSHYANGDSSLPSEEAPVSQLQVSQFLHGLKDKLNLGDAYPVLLYGSGALVAVWLSTAIVGAIDSIPVFPKLLEVVGLGFSIWFSYRYLIFKDNREELFTKIEVLKREIIGGSEED